jgi:hypothetical protein
MDCIYLQANILVMASDMRVGRKYDKVVAAALWEEYRGDEMQLRPHYNSYTPYSPYLS